MKQRKTPMRKCVVCQEMRPKKELLRIVRDKEGNVEIDPTGKLPGRGAYIAVDIEVAKRAQAHHSLDRVLNVTIPDSFYQELVDYVEHVTIRQELLNQHE